MKKKTNLKKTISNSGRGSTQARIDALAFKAIQKLVQSEFGAKAVLRKRHALSLQVQPFDDFLCRKSPTYRICRVRFLESGGVYVPSLLSSGRTLSSGDLMLNRIEYSPTESEMIWAALNPIEKKSQTTLLQLRKYSTSLLHETHHRLLWSFLPNPSFYNPMRVHWVRHLHLCESLVVAMDMAMGDELGHAVSYPLYLMGVVYDPGTSLRAEARSKREYRNLLHMAAYSTYLLLQKYDPNQIPKVIESLWPIQDPQKEKLQSRMIQRALRLDPQFVWNTSPKWERKNLSAVIDFYEKNHRSLEVGSLSGQSEIVLPSDPMDHRVFYLWAEKWFESCGV